MARLELSLRLLVFLALGLLAPTFPVLASAQSNDITLSLGGIAAQSRTLRSPPAGSTQISADVSLGANYGHGLLHAEFAALYAEIQFVALPNRSVTPATAIVPQNYASLYVTPGLRLKVLPRARLSPWVALGGGYALYEQSAKLSNYQLFRLFGLRGEVRDSVSGNPNLNVALSSSTQHNIVASGGISVHF